MHAVRRTHPTCLLSAIQGRPNQPIPTVERTRRLAGAAGQGFAFAIVAWAVAAFEHSTQVSPFSSKYDAVLAGKAELSALERQGLALFNGKARCSSCHPSAQGPDGQPPMFTDFTYDNLGIPPNPANPFYRVGKKFNPDGKKWVDLGLADALRDMPRYVMLAAAQRG